MTQTMIITGGAGFIGANFVRMALAQTDARIVVVDKLTYAGHRENLEDLWRDSRLQFIQADIADEAARSLQRSKAKRRRLRRIVLDGS